MTLTRKLAVGCLAAAIAFGLCSIAFAIAKQPYANRATAALDQGTSLAQLGAVVGGSDYRTAILLRRLTTATAVFSAILFVASAVLWKRGVT